VTLPKTTDDWRATALPFFVGICIAGLGNYLSFGREAVTRKEMQTYVRQQSPYALDQRYIRQRLDDIANDTQRIGAIEQRLSALEAIVRSSHP